MTAEQWNFRLCAFMLNWDKGILTRTCKGNQAAHWGFSPDVPDNIEEQPKVTRKKAMETFPLDEIPEDLNDKWNVGPLTTSDKATGPSHWSSAEFTASQARAPAPIPIQREKKRDVRDRDRPRRSDRDRDDRSERSSRSSRH